jgi:glycosyltransferase involved in cell wall biosynthesis
LESILEQDFDDFEVVIVDNTSVDDTLEIVKSFHDSRIRIFSNNGTLPIAENWNRVVSFAQADLVKVVCADDLIARNCLSMQVGTMRNPRIALVSSIFDIIDDDGILLAHARGLPRLQGLHSSEEVSRVLVRRIPDEIAPTAAFMFRREQFVKTCGFRSDFEYALDIDLFARLCMNGDFFGHSESLAINRASTFNYSSRTSSISKFIDILKFNHAMLREFPERVGMFDVAMGDLRVARAGLRRLRVRTGSLLGV